MGPVKKRSLLLVASLGALVLAAALIAARLIQFGRVNADKADFLVGSANRVTVDCRCAVGRALILANE